MSKPVYYLITKKHPEDSEPQHVCINVYATEKDDRGGWVFLAGGFHDQWSLQNNTNSYRQSLLNVDGGYPYATAKRICPGKVRKLFKQYGKDLRIF